MNQQTKAQRLAAAIVSRTTTYGEHREAAALLLRQDELLKQAQEALSKGTSWMEHGELIAAIRAHREAK